MLFDAEAVAILDVGREATFLKVTMHSTSSPAKTIEFLNWMDTRMFDGRLIVWDKTPIRCGGEGGVQSSGGRGNVLRCDLDVAVGFDPKLSGCLFYLRLPIR